MLNSTLHYNTTRINPRLHISAIKWLSTLFTGCFNQLVGQIRIVILVADSADDVDALECRYRNMTTMRICRQILK